MNRIITLGLGLCVAIAFTSCKSQESAYKKAYEKAKQQQAVQQQQPVAQTQQQVAVVPTPQTVAPAPAKKATVVSDANVRTESLQLVDGTGLKAYSVICGSFSLKSNAQGLQKTLKGKGYGAQIAFNGKLYRVVASTFDDRASAAASRNKLRDDYPDAWLLYNK